MATYKNKTVMFKGQIDFKEAHSAKFRIIDLEHILPEIHRVLFFDKFNHAMSAFKELRSRYVTLEGVNIQMRLNFPKADRCGNMTPWESIVQGTQKYFKMRECSRYRGLVGIKSLVGYVCAGLRTTPSIPMKPKKEYFIPAEDLIEVIPQVFEEEDAIDWTSNLIR